MRRRWRRFPTDGLRGPIAGDSRRGVGRRRQRGYGRFWLVDWVPTLRGEAPSRAGEVRVRAREACLGKRDGSRE